MDTNTIDNNFNIEWYSDKNLGIYMSDTPQISIRYALPSTTKEEKKSIKKYPFINRKDLNVTIIDYKKTKKYRFLIPKGYCFDGASIPKLFWRLIGSNTDNEFLVPAMIHDTLCEHHEYINNDRKLSSEIFDALLKTNGVNHYKRFLMKKSVDIFQNLFCNW